MKKLMITTAALAVASIVTAQTVTSQNIVGYAKDSAGANATILLAAQFSGTAGSTVLADAFSGLSVNDRVYLWNGGGYDLYQYYGPVNGWFSKTFVPSNGLLIPDGTGIFFETFSGVAADPIAAGEVPSAASIPVALSTGFNLVANPYPVAITLDGLSALGGLALNDQVFVWNGGGYDQYQYYGPVNGWFSKTFVPSGNVVLPVGNGFWVNSLAGGTITFVKNF